MDDSISGYQVGFRSDVDLGGSSLTVQGDYFEDEKDQRPSDGDRGGNFTLRWQGDLDERSSLQVQAYYDHFRRRFVGARDALETLDLETQYNRTAGAHEIVAGFGVRTTRDEFVNTANIFGLTPASRRLWIWSAFAQDRIALSDQLSLIAGIKLERSSYSGIEVLPNVRLAWHPNPNHLLWAAVSRAVRTPARIDRDLEGLPIIVRATEFRSEKLIAFEAGYRGQPSSDTSLSVSVFYNVYDDIRSAELLAIPFPARLGNDLTGHTYGLEAGEAGRRCPGGG